MVTLHTDIALCRKDGLGDPWESLPWGPGVRSEFGLGDLPD